MDPSVGCVLLAEDRESENRAAEREEMNHVWFWYSKQSCACVNLFSVLPSPYICVVSILSTHLGCMRILYVGLGHNSI